MTLARRATLDIMYNNFNITANLQRNLLGWAYTDNLSGQADDLQIDLEDTKHLWSGNWMPNKGATLKATIIRSYWVREGKVEKTPIGRFEVDEIEIASPPSTASIKAISVPESSSLRGQEKYRAWEETTLKVIVSDIAKRNKVKLYYDTDENPDYDRIEQTGESDLVFLMRICRDAGLCLKVSNKQIVIFGEEKYEQQKPALTIKKGAAYIKGYRGRTTLNGTYKSCRVQYTDPKKKKTISYTFTPKKPPKTSRILVVNERVKSVKEAQRLAKRRLRQENKEATTFSISLVGDARYWAGMTVNLLGFGKFDGKYIITQATHSQRGSYDTQLELRKCLEGY